uniref:ATP synthase subunit a n=1 Tax=Membranipora grandicella TaxID=192923 RepID=I6M192_9BILA|nr:ATP synthase F0 subunit 6 [Membranipora grandicella]AEH99601.1 ATP synthase F0 subunit 6 [Membranipora grandicella]
MLDIFASFDPENMVILNLYYLIWSLLLLSPLYIFSVGSNRFVAILTLVMNIIYNLTIRSKSKLSTASFSIMLSMFIMIIYLNLVGLMPYTFSWTSHLSINLGMAFTLWLSIVIMSFSYDPLTFLAHLVPTGTPTLLSPFLVLIETVSIMVRPLTLAVRLTANIMTGHIIMTLVAEASSISPVFPILVMFYFMFELAICAVQAYIFTLLPILYMDEHA